ncbi:MAG: ATP synthase F1 subunit delta [Planctomycetota bacterium]|jgi:F-type H+-transporting ATPase subunit delta
MPGNAIVCKRYAKAFFRLARSLDRIEEMGRELALCAEALSGDVSVERFWATPVASLNRKEHILDEALDSLGDAMGEPARKFMHVLVRNGRLGLIGHIREAYSRMAEAAAGEVPVIVHTAMPLGGEQRRALEGALSAKFGGGVILEMKEDPSLIAGLTVRVRDVLYDGSARGRLERFLRRLETGETVRGR